MLRDVLRLPVRVVVTVLHPLIPDLNLVVKIFLVRVGERSHFEKELVAVGSPVHKRLAKVLSWPGSLLTKDRNEVEGVRQPEGAVVMHVVAKPVVGHRRLRGSGSQSRMRVDDRLRRVVSRK